MTPAADNATRLVEHERLVAALLADPRAMAVPPAQRSLVTTAISSLVLAGDEVFKLRKPLELGFLDFSTLERRRHDCDEELRLNRRTAPSIYLDVLPVTGSVEAPRLGGEPRDAIEWALRMRRFDDTQRLDRLADRHQLGAALIDALALAVARFHAALPHSPTEYGRPGSVRHWALENFDELEAGPAAHSHGTRIAALRAWTDAEFAHLAPLLAARHAGGFVRECHGDLHLANIALVDGEPLLFDCLEFNPSLRHIDVMADLGFLFMDLQRRGLRAFAWRVVNAWSEHTGDYDGLAALRFFAVYRALVRAKVALLRTDQHDAGAWDAFERDFALAEMLAAPRRGPLHLVVTSGVSGSGKSTVAQQLVDALGAIRVRSDVERKRLFSMAAQERPTAGKVKELYGREATVRTYARLGELAGKLLAAGLHAIVDAAFLRRHERDAMRPIAAAAGARLTLIECTAPEPVLRDRVHIRTRDNRDASDADLPVLEQQLRVREPPAAEEFAQRVGTDTDLDTLRCRALDAIGEPGIA